MLKFRHSSRLALVASIIVVICIENSDVTFGSTIQKLAVQDNGRSDQQVLAIREISFADLNALDNYYHLTIIGGKYKDAIFEG